MRRCEGHDVGKYVLGAKQRWFPACADGDRVGEVCLGIGVYVEARKSVRVGVCEH